MLVELHTTTQTNPCGAFWQESGQLDNFNRWLKFYNILTTINFNMVVGHNLGVTSFYLIPSLGVLAF